MIGAEDREAAFLNELGRRVRHARTVRGLSRKLLSQTSGLSERYIAQLESGRGNVSIILLRRVANAMGVRLDDMIAEQETASDWIVLRDLVADASPDQIAHAKTALAGTRHGGNQGARPRVAVVGLRGAGKSTLGRRAAERLGWSFVELNDEIERESALPVREIFAIYGQEGYRRVEQKALRSLVDHPGPLILATSGSIVAEPLTYDLLLQSFFTIWIRATAEEHMQRVREQGHLDASSDDGAALAELRAVLASREPLYDRAPATIDTSGISVDLMVDRLVGAIEARFGASAPSRGVRKSA